jgi:hypothetical protein
MKITTKRKIDLKPYTEQFEILFSWNKKNGVPNNKYYWFTPSGKCKIYIGALSIIFVGDVTEAQTKKLRGLLKKNKTEVFTDGRDYFTTTGSNSISEIVNMSSILYQARNEWEERKYIEDWVEDDRVYYRNEWNELVCD